MLRGAMAPQVLERETVVQDLGDGCSKNCGCVWSLTIAEVIAQRTINKGLLQSEQRGDCRKFLIKNPLPSSKFGFRLHANDVERTLCVVGRHCRRGWHASTEAFSPRPATSPCPTTPPPPAPGKYSLDETPLPPPTPAGARAGGSEPRPGVGVT